MVAIKPTSHPQEWWARAQRAGWTRRQYISFLEEASMRGLLSWPDTQDRMMAAIYDPEYDQEGDS